MSILSDDPWREFAEFRARFKSFLSKGKAEKINSRDARETASGMAQHFFRVVRPTLIQVGIDDAEMIDLDRSMQDLNTLAQGVNRRSSYKKALQTIITEANRLSPIRDRLIGAATASAGEVSISALQMQIASTLESLVPSAALSYRQAISDLADSNRLSFRGCAVELREALREVVDHFAPDQTVRATPGFQLEKGRDRPTMRQKVQFILRSRGQGETSIATSKDAAEHIEVGPDRVARSLYNRGSASTHIAASRQEVTNLLRYTEALLAELLQV